MNYKGITQRRGDIFSPVKRMPDSVKFWIGAWAAIAGLAIVIATWVTVIFR